MKRKPRAAEPKAAGSRTLGGARWAMVAVCISVAACALAAYPLVDTGSRGGSQTLLDRAARLPDREMRADYAAKAERLIRNDLSWSPGSSGGWAQLAYAQALEGGTLTPQASQTLLKSYDLSPYDADLLMWRTAFVFRNWTAAPPPLRDAAFEEVNAFARFNIHRKALMDLAPYITDRSGQFALLLAAVGGSGGEAKQ